tara:strand:- start:45 stop:437 length:393 start_codon:yes stop_codon:yes gene_type:complete
MIKRVCTTVCLVFAASVAHAQSEDWESMSVAASAYNSLPSQTANDPTIAAWGDKLKPGMNAIAVSRDLIKKGLTHGTKVRIKGLPGVYIVRDKMAARWKNKIDIYMGKDVQAALDWGMRHDIEIEYAENS